MIDLAGLPLPDNAPPTGSCARVEHPSAGLARLVLDPPHRPKIAVFDVPLLADLDLALGELERDSALRGLVVTGRKPLSFCAGADVETLARLADPALVRRFVAEGQKLFQRLHRLGRYGGGRLSTVAAVGGPVPGGACEIALACDRIVLADHEKTRIGLPEVKLGIFPAWGGSQRLPRRLGVAAALGAILTGRLYTPHEALRLGLADRLTAPEYLVQVADRIALGAEHCPRRGSSGVRKALVDRNPLATAFFVRKARASVLRETHGHYPAPLAVIPLVARGARGSLAEGLERELEAVLPLASSPVSKNLIGLFLLSEEQKKLGEHMPGTSARGFERAAVLGAGVMGGAIASMLAEKGVAVRLRDLDRRALDAAVLRHRADVEANVKRKRLKRHAADAVLDRLEATTEAQGFGRVELVIEAVAEKLEVKRAVFGELARLAPPDAVLATNTSSLSVSAIAAGLPNPERVVGMHFFNPVKRMPLVEIVRGRETSDESVTRVARLALDLGKTPVVVADVAGFLVNRVLGPYLDEAIRLVEAGLDPDEIDTALVRFGMPMGPCELLDEVGLDIALHAAASLEAAYGPRMRSSRYLAPRVEQKELGKKSGAGLYTWRKSRGGKLEKLGRNPRLGDRRGLALAEEEIVARCVLAMANEAVRCLEERVVARASELDLATVFGSGFAPFRGGVLRYLDARGAPEVALRLRALQDAPDVAPNADRKARFEPCALLAEMARSGARFH
jgi:3-hydroxyacyl-CoA dehydrogenase/enoyl-CoA hydratase/3-hydroxybutyryl-CoA epimerase